MSPPAPLQDCVRSITLDPAFVMGHTRLAHILEDLQEYQQAIDTLQAVCPPGPTEGALGGGGGALVGVACPDRGPGAAGGRAAPGRPCCAPMDCLIHR